MSPPIRVIGLPSLHILPILGHGEPGAYPRKQRAQGTKTLCMGYRSITGHTNTMHCCIPICMLFLDCSKQQEYLRETCTAQGVHNSCRATHWANMPPHQIRSYSILKFPECSAYTYSLGCVLFPVNIINFLDVLEVFQKTFGAVLYDSCSAE